MEGKWTVIIDGYDNHFYLQDSEGKQRIPIKNLGTARLLSKLYNSNKPRTKTGAYK